MYQETTRGFRVEVEPRFLPDHSSAENQQFIFLYRIRIQNEGDETAQLVSRHWIIRDGNGDEREVEGPGVVGEQPLLAPGESFEYESFCPLATPTGNMRGKFQMKTSEGGQFDIRVPLFFLRDSQHLH